MTQLEAKQNNARIIQYCRYEHITLSTPPAPQPPNNRKMALAIAAAMVVGGFAGLAWLLS